MGMVWQLSKQAGEQVSRWERSHWDWPVVAAQCRTERLPQQPWARVVSQTAPCEEAWPMPDRLRYRTRYMLQPFIGFWEVERDCTGL